MEYCTLRLGGVGNVAKKRRKSAPATTCGESSMPNDTDRPTDGGQLQPLPPEGQLLIYQDGATRLQVRLEGRTVWLSQRDMATLFQTTVPNVNQHLTTIYGEGELNSTANTQRYLIVQTEGLRQVSRNVEHYNLDAILAV